jgi:hypothetical protein
VLNIIALFVSVLCLIVLPAATESYLRLSQMVLGAGSVLIAFHPFTIATQERRWNRAGRNQPITDGKDHPCATREELLSSSFSILRAL